ncbi:unnamed protein product [Nezara viridula]|uniref:Copine-3 n=1 Tax=Nezara viridula TaxID=85310 RepID=A0A9P0E2G7_NEZVI|nr:unnamed protein product [Nezara viridula]
MAFVPGSASQPTAEVELSISCRSLQGMDLLSKSDPMCVTYIRPFGESRWVEYHRTERISNCHDPHFVSKIHMVYRFEEQQPLKFEMYDCDSPSTNLADHDFLGFATCNLAQIINGGKLEMLLQPREKGHYLNSNSNLGYIQIMAEELQTNKDEVTFKFSGHKLDRKDWFGRSDPFLELHKSTESGMYTLVHKTEVIKFNLNPRWNVFTLPVRSICNGDYERSIKIVCYDWNRSGNHSLIGEFYTNLNSLLDETSSRRFTLVNPEIQAKKKGSYKSSGEIIVEKCDVRRIYSFLDYIKGGTQIFCTFAIDFTGSNGNPSNPDSLHFITEFGQNAYEQAIISVGTIIEDYDSDKQFPVLGFGAKLPPDGRVSHEFFVNMHPTNPYCDRVHGVLQAYRSCLRQIQLYGPTNFASVIKHVMKFASTYTDGSSYFILLILTDGVITDMPQTCKAIVEASNLPISIIIVGIGSADFSAMEVLDGDTVALTSGGIRASRDIVQFVPFSKVMGSPNAGALLAREVLAEIPTQFVSFMKSRNIAPKPPITSVTTLPPDPSMYN